ncbi:hypothetical protein AMTR_s00052p00155320 [Amborella trichopoda]|uniref:Uncharacterized protein n=1 Tax=Amborella trichopoda TaxID=13333 RepID=U5D1W3_AMBTC|nr:hypothetical protein AMTR_s00052p00155320 [Amborella trichopoda]
MRIYVDSLPTGDPQPNVPPPSTSTKVQPWDSRGKATNYTVREESYIIDPFSLIFLCIILATRMIPREAILQEPLRDISMPAIQNDQGHLTPSESQTWHQDIMMTITPEILEEFALP